MALFHLSCSHKTFVHCFGYYCVLRSGCFGYLCATSITLASFVHFQLGYTMCFVYSQNSSELSEERKNLCTFIRFHWICFDLFSIVFPLNALVRYKIGYGSPEYIDQFGLFLFNAQEPEKKNDFSLMLENW